MEQITHTIKAKYYIYVPGEFMPIMSGDELLNKREFHAYKLRRAIWRVSNWRMTYHQLTHSQG